MLKLTLGGMGNWAGVELLDNGHYLVAKAGANDTMKANEMIADSHIRMTTLLIANGVPSICCAHARRRPPSCPSSRQSARRG